MDAIAELERGRESYATGAWRKAFESLSGADRATPLGAEDLELLARAAYMLGRDDDYLGGLERAHQAHLDAGDVARAARCAFWIGHNLLFRGERGRASGWFSRANRMFERIEEDCVERGCLLIPAWLSRWDAAITGPGYMTAGEAAEIGGRFGDATCCGSPGMTKAAP